MSLKNPVSLELQNKIAKLTFKPHSGITFVTVRVEEKVKSLVSSESFISKTSNILTRDIDPEKCFDVYFSVSFPSIFEPRCFPGDLYWTERDSWNDNEPSSTVLRLKQNKDLYPATNSQSYKFSKLDFSACEIVITVFTDYSCESFVSLFDFSNHKTCILDKSDVEYDSFETKATVNKRHCDHMTHIPIYKPLTIGKINTVSVFGFGLENITILLCCYEIFTCDSNRCIRNLVRCEQVFLGQATLCQVQFYLPRCLNPSFTDSHRSISYDLYFQTPTVSVYVPVKVV